MPEKVKMIPAFNVTVPQGTYMKEGKEKTRWLNVGTLFIAEDKSRMALKIDSMPVGIKDFEGWFNVFPKQRDGQGTTIDQAKAAAADGDVNIDQMPIDLSEIPF